MTAAAADLVSDAAISTAVPGPLLYDGMGRLYVVQARETRNIKIGFSTRRTDERIRELQIGSHEPLDLVLLSLGSRVDERVAHRLVRHHRIRGEWFGESALPLIREHIEFKKKIEAAGCFAEPLRKLRYAHFSDKSGEKLQLTYKLNREQVRKTIRLYSGAACDDPDYPDVLMTAYVRALLVWEEDPRLEFGRALELYRRAQAISQASPHEARP